MQEENESFQLFLSALRKLVIACNYCDNCVDSIFRDRIVLGIKEATTQQELLKERQLTLERALAICRVAGNATLPHQLLVNKVPVSKIKERQTKGHKKARQNSRQPPPDSRCKFCNRNHPLVKSQCAAYGKECSHCGKKNHFKVKCPKLAKVHQFYDEQTGDAESSSESSSEWIDCINMSPRKDVKCRIMMPDKSEVIFQVDTGSSVNVLPAKYHPSHLPHNCVNKTLLAWNEGMTTALGTYRHNMRNPLNNKKYSIELVVVKEKYTPILGLKASQVMTFFFVTVNDNEFEQVSSLRIEDFDEVFSETLGSLPGVHTLQVNKSVAPVVMADRRIPISVRPKLKEELERLVMLGMLQPVAKPTPWVSQLVIAPKKSGAICICIDPR